MYTTTSTKRESSPTVISNQFQRIVILHLNIAQLSTGCELGESALPEELGEQILYDSKHPYSHYYSNTSNYQQEPSTENDDLLEAIQFAGLCSALYNLPETLQNFTCRRDDDDYGDDDGRLEKIDECPRDTTLEVQLDNSFLVFVPLESDNNNSREDQKHALNDCNNYDKNNPKIVAVAQISRSSPCCGNPAAIRASIQRWHKLFCLLRGGGVHAGLMRDDISNNHPLAQKGKNITSCINSSKNSPKKKENQCLYPGMDQLFQGKKTLRQLRQAIMRLSEPDSDLLSEHETLVKDLSLFQQILPIASIRDDLKYHFDAFIGDITLIMGKEGGAGHCLVDLLPAPIAMADGRHSIQWGPKCPPPHVTFYLNQTIRTLLSEHSKMLLAVSTFHGELLFHHDHNVVIGDSLPNDTCMPDTATLLMWYFAFYSYKSKQQLQKQQVFESSTPPRRISRGLVSFSDHAVTSVDDGDACTNPCRNTKQNRGHFLETPPLHMLSASEQNTTSVHGPNGVSVWAPLVYLNDCLKECQSNSNKNKNKNSNEGHSMVHVMLYECGPFSFLFYTCPGVSSKSNGTINISNAPLQQDEEGGTSFILDKISTTISDLLEVVAMNDVNTAMSQTQRDFSNAPGHVIFVNRTTNQMMLFPRLPREVVNDGKSSKSKFFFMDVFRQTENKATGLRTKQNLEHDATTWAEEGMDCRHWLASRLSVSALNAFDDAMNDIVCWQKHRQNIGGNIASDCGNHEILTTIPDGWLYAFADQQDNEIYTFFDSRDCVTITDVQHAITLTRTTLLNKFAT